MCVTLMPFDFKKQKALLKKRENEKVSRPRREQRGAGAALRVVHLQRAYRTMHLELPGKD